MISPFSSSTPTFTTSYIFDPFMCSVRTTGPDILEIIPAIMSSSPYHDIIPDRPLQHPFDVAYFFDTFDPGGNRNDDRSVGLADLFLHFFIKSWHQIFTDRYNACVVLIEQGGNNCL